jgi:RimJ/RimL family protein N-acetyltransferase
MRVTFRPVVESDLRRLNEIVNDGEVAHFLSLIPSVSLNSTRGHFLSCRRNKSLWYSVVVDGSVAGSFLLTPHKRDGKMAHGAGFGIDLAKEYWGKGVGVKSVDYALRKAKSLGLKRVELEVVAENLRARRLYGKCGFSREGVKRKSFKIGRKYHDTIVMARLLA